LAIAESVEALKRTAGKKAPLVLVMGAEMNPLWSEELLDAMGSGAEMLDVRLVLVFVEVGTPEGRLAELKSCIRPQDGLG